MGAFPGRPFFIAKTTVTLFAGIRFYDRRCVPQETYSKLPCSTARYMTRKRRAVVLKIAITLLLIMGSTANGIAQQSPANTLIGKPVIAADGAKVGEVADVSTDETGDIEFLRVTTGIRLGLGERHIVIPNPAFMIKSATVVLPDLTSDDVAAWPDDHTERSGLRQEER